VDLRKVDGLAPPFQRWISKVDLRKIHGLAPPFQRWISKVDGFKQ
jgi:hypothetical protein